MSAMFYYLSGQLGRHTEKGEGLTLLYRNFLFKGDLWRFSKQKYSCPTPSPDCSINNELYKLKVDVDTLNTANNY